MDEKMIQSAAKSRIQGQQVRDNEPVEIDLLQVFFAIKNQIWLVLLAALIGASMAAAYTAFLITPMYTSSSMMIVLTKETTIASIADLQIGAQLTNDYSVLINSRPVMNETIKNLGLDMDYKTLRRQISVVNESDTRILTISAKMSDPKLAKRVVDEVATVSAAYIADKMEVQAPKIIEEGEIPLQRTSPSMSKNMMMGFLAGTLVVCALIALEEILNDTIASEDDISRYMGLTTLAMVPDREESGKKKKRKNKRK